MRTVNEMHGAVVMKQGKKNAHKRGKIRYAVFHPTEPRLMGFIVHRHDTLGMVKHDDRFLAYDSFTVSDGRVWPIDEKSAWDEDACERLGIEYEKCLVLKGMPVQTESGESLGKISDIEYDESNGNILKLILTEGRFSSMLIGNSEQAPEEFMGFRDGKVIFKDDAVEVDPAGGAAAAAGEAVGKIAMRVKTQGPKVAKATDDAIQKGAYKTGELIGQVRDKAKEKAPEARKAASAADDAVQRGAYKFGEMLGKTKGMFSDFKEEYDKEAHGDD